MLDDKKNVTRVKRFKARKKVKRYILDLADILQGLEDKELAIVFGPDKHGNPPVLDKLNVVFKEASRGILCSKIALLTPDQCLALSAKLNNQGIQHEPWRLPRSKSYKLKMAGKLPSHEVEVLVASDEELKKLPILQQRLEKLNEDTKKRMGDLDSYWIRMDWEIDNRRSKDLRFASRAKVIKYALDLLFEKLDSGTYQPQLYPIASKWVEDTANG